jgi:hypothetical protein
MLALLLYKFPQSVIAAVAFGLGPDSKAGDRSQSLGPSSGSVDAGCEKRSLDDSGGDGKVPAEHVLAIGRPSDGVAAVDIGVSLVEGRAMGPEGVPHPVIHSGIVVMAGSHVRRSATV